MKATSSKTHSAALTGRKGYRINGFWIPRGVGSEQHREVTPIPVAYGLDSLAKITPGFNHSQTSGPGRLFLLGGAACSFDEQPTTSRSRRLNEET